MPARKSKVKNQRSKVQVKSQRSKISVSKKLSASVVTRKVLKANKKPATTETQKKKEAQKQGRLSIDVFDTKGKVVRSVDLPKEIFGAKINKQLLAQAVRVYLANQRIGTASTKDRGEVHGSTRKIYRQKGTGRARHGSKKAPIFVHGGIVFGPKPRDFSLKMSKKMKRLALFSALSAKKNANEIKAVKGLDSLGPKTKLMVEVLNNLEINNKDKNILLVLSGKSTKDLENIYRSARNIEGLNIINADILNAYDALNNKLILLMESSIEHMKERFLKESI